jgi:hypothetical protein
VAGEDRNNAAGNVLLPAIVLALVGAFIFLWVSAFYWLSSLFDPVFGALLMALFFAVVSMTVFATAVYLRDQTKRSALAARQANRGALLADPAILKMALAAGRKLGWHRTIPIAFLAAIAFQAPLRSLRDLRPAIVDDERG